MNSKVKQAQKEGAVGFRLFPQVLLTLLYKNALYKVI
mgnify:CR=1 FL=1